MPITWYWELYHSSISMVIVSFYFYPSTTIRDQTLLNWHIAGPRNFLLYLSLIFPIVCSHTVTVYDWNPIKADVFSNYISVINLPFSFVLYSICLGLLNGFRSSFLWQTCWVSIKLLQRQNLSFLMLLHQKWNISSPKREEKVINKGFANLSPDLKFSFHV